MARTNRKDVPPPATSVDALDDLNLDDMFEGGDDSLFEGLDIDLDGMGDITGALGNKGDDKEVSEDLGAMGFKILGPGEPGESKTTSKRRKTKRKSKTPPPLEDEDSESASPSKKKKRTSKSTKRSKSKSKQKEGSPSPSSTSSKSRSKAKSSTMPPPMSRGTSGGPGMVAAAGQFGGRTQKRGTYSVPHGKATMVSPAKAKGRTSSTSSVTSRGSRQQHEEALNEASQESTFCGLLPSSILFYPFMPTLPPEPSMKKCNKLHPCLDNIHSTLNTHSNSSTTPPNAHLSTPALHTDPLFRLLFADSDHHNTGPSDSSSSQMLRRATLTSALDATRKTVSHMEKSRLVSDLHSLCALLKRQHGFLSQNIENMERWCLDHFNEQDNATLLGPTPAATASTGRKRKSVADAPASQGLFGPNLRGLIGAVVKVKVKCSGFKEPKMSAVLLAKLPGAMPPIPIAARPPGLLVSSTKNEASKRKRKIASVTSLALAEKTLSTPAVVTPEVDEVVTYEGLKPLQRREQIVEAVDAQARHLEQKYFEAKECRQLSVFRQEAELRQVIEDDEMDMANTTTLWKWVAKSSHFADYTEDDINEVLHFAWQPELNSRRMFSEDVPPVHVTVRRKESASEDVNDTGKKENSSKASAKSLFDRLQSLLVDEGSDDEVEDNNGDFPDDWEGETNGSQVTESKEKSTAVSASDIREGAILDLSELNLEERTFIQLRSIGLVDSPFLPSPHPVLIEEDESLSEEGEGNSNDEAPLFPPGKRGPDGVEEDNLDDVLRAMRCDLSRLQRLNNSRTAVLQSAARAHLAEMQQSKKKEDERTQQITRYNLLLKKQKEVKRSSRQKTVKKDEDWVPW